MAKRKSGSADLKKKAKKLAESLGGSMERLGSGKRRPWPEQKKRARSRARKAGYDADQIVVSCWGAFEDQITDCAEETIRICEDGFMDEGAFPEVLCTAFADKLALPFRHGNDSTITDEAMELAVSLVYLFPDLWKAINKTLTLEKMKALDFDVLLIKRR